MRWWASTAGGVQCAARVPLVNDSKALVRTTGRGRLPIWMQSRWIKIGAGVVLIAIAIAAVVIATHWPFTQDSVVQALEQAFASSVELKSFHVTYFAPGCVIEGVTFRR